MPHLIARQTLARANSAMLLLLIGGGLLICATGAVIYDLGRMLGAW